jgi:hypothetical protein
MLHGIGRPVAVDEPMHVGIEIHGDAGVEVRDGTRPQAKAGRGQDGLCHEIMKMHSRGRGTTPEIAAGMPKNRFARRWTPRSPSSRREPVSAAPSLIKCVRWPPIDRGVARQDDPCHDP